MKPAQSLLELDDALPDAVALLGDADRQDRGGIYTRREVVDFILDLVGYEAEHDLTSFRLLEPSCGAGDFIVTVVDRLIDSAKLHGVRCEKLTHCILAVDIGTHAIQEARSSVASLLKEKGISKKNCNPPSG